MDARESALRVPHGFQQRSDASGAEALVVEVRPTLEIYEPIEVALCVLEGDKLHFASLRPGWRRPSRRQAGGRAGG